LRERDALLAATQLIAPSTAVFARTLALQAAWLLLLGLASRDVARGRAQAAARGV